MVAVLVLSDQLADVLTRAGAAACACLVIPEAPKASGSEMFIGAGPTAPPIWISPGVLRFSPVFPSR